LSYWEQKNFLAYDLIVVGAGFTGLSAAIHYKKSHKKANVLVLDRGVFPSGASTKNAGFACFGSLTEILDDFWSMTPEEVTSLVEKRYSGLCQIRKQFGDKALRYQHRNGYELLGEEQMEALEQLPDINKLLKKIFKKEVFNVAQNKYTYSDAEPLCKAFGAELATYDQVKSAWNKGADWCNYGWIKGQAAVYPTQPSTYNKLQAGPEDQRMACGVVGINGGYFDNPEHRFGVNCYGTKPSENDADIRNIMANPKNMTPGALAYDKKVQDYKHQMGHLPVNPFKEGSWFS
jgi:hypothetical protein